MKKILIASTAMVLVAGAAAADTSMSGFGRFGLAYNSAPGAGMATTQLTYRYQMLFNASKTTDSGVTFGMQIGLRSDAYSADGIKGGYMYAKAGGLEVRVGNVNAALAQLNNNWSANLGLTGLSYDDVVENSVGQAGYWAFGSDTGKAHGNDGVVVTYGSGPITVRASIVNAQAGNANVSANTPSVAVSADYIVGNFDIGAGYQKGGTTIQDKWVLSLGGKIGAANVGVNYGSNNGSSHVTVYGNTTFGATTVAAYVTNDATAANTGYGLGASYDIGGAAIIAGYNYTTSGANRADLGVKFSF